MQFINFLKKIFNKKKILQPSVYNISGTKHSLNSACTLKLSSETENKKKQINENLKNLLKKYIDSPEKLIQYIKLHGIKVYKIKNASKLLSKIREEEGFLTPLKGWKALIMNFVIGILIEEKINFKLSTKEMFIFNEGETEIYTIARALHKYYGFKNKLPGFDYKSQEIFKKVYGNMHTKQGDALSSCASLKDMYACKEALARDLESINFTISLSVEYERAKKALGILQSTKSTNI